MVSRIGLQWLLCYCCCFWMSSLLGLASARLGKDTATSITLNKNDDEGTDGSSASTAARDKRMSWENVRVLKRSVDKLFRDNHEGDELAVIVGYKSVKGRSHVHSLTKRNRKQRDFKRIRAVATKITKKRLRALENDEDIEYIEPDYMRYQMGGSIVPYGIKLTQASSHLPKPSTITTARSCSSPDAFRVAIVDSGIYAAHPDLQCNERKGVGCVGQSFGTLAAWDRDWNSHGTHVSGTIAALGNNGQGVRGIVKDGGICLVIVRVFSDYGGAASLSDILNGVRWAVEKQNATVVSMSLGSSFYSITEDRFYQDLFTNKGSIVVAASGNDGTFRKAYPASYTNVLSVAAVNSTQGRANFSQYNSMVDIAAPGVGILSTVPPGLGGIISLKIENSSKAFETRQLSLSVSLPSNGISGMIVSCPDLGRSKCPGTGGHICLIERGIITFEQKALNCQASGGKAAIIYNNGDDIFGGTLSIPTKVTIPVLSIARVDGLRIANEFLNWNGFLLFEDGYATYDGTSMATPHVTGAIAAIWRTCRRCQNIQVVNCLLNTAKDLGPWGRDDEYGYGLVQTKAAYACLNATCCN